MINFDQNEFWSAKWLENGQWLTVISSTDLLGWYASNILYTSAINTVMTIFWVCGTLDYG